LKPWQKPTVINTGKAATYGPALARIQARWHRLDTRGSNALSVDAVGITG
jgi:hypothetical protein